MTLEVHTEDPKAALEVEKLRLEVEEKGLQIEALRYSKLREEAHSYNSRIYTLAGGVTENSVHRAIETLGYWHRERPGARIEFVINSQGGSIFDGMALFDFVQRIRDAGTPVDTTGIGMAASMGGVLLQMGETRRMSRHAWLMVHEASTYTWGTTSQIKDEQELLEGLQKRLVEILAERSTLTARQINNRTKRKDWWLPADEALKFGFVDEIV